MSIFKSKTVVNAKSEKICCGDTTFCGECKLFKTVQGTPAATMKLFTKNALGRCDFYRGPSEVLIAA